MINTYNDFHTVLKVFSEELSTSSKSPISLKTILKQIFSWAQLVVFLSSRNQGKTLHHQETLQSIPASQEENKVFHEFYNFMTEENLSGVKHRVQPNFWFWLNLGSDCILFGWFVFGYVLLVAI